MVFNPQNPNAPPIYPCGVCHKEVHDNDQAIPCESGCNFWFHRFVKLKATKNNTMYSSTSYATSYCVPQDLISKNINSLWKSFILSLVIQDLYRLN